VRIRARGEDTCTQPSRLHASDPRGVCSPAVARASRHLSPRLRPALELGLGLGLLEGDLWWWRTPPNPLAHWIALAGLGLLFAASHLRRRDEGPAGPAPGNPGRAWMEVALATVLLALAVLGLGAGLRGPRESLSFAFLGSQPAEIWGWGIRRVGIALGQQIALQLFLWPLCLELLSPRRAALALAAFLFGLLHLPSPWLAALSGSGALIWIVLYQRAGRLLPLVASQVALAILVQAALPARLHYGMRVGREARAAAGRFSPSQSAALEPGVSAGPRGR
jgi:Type II CAAX prenyl endopeptidase Rce1-like